MHPFTSWEEIELTHVRNIEEYLDNIMYSDEASLDQSDHKDDEEPPTPKSKGSKENDLEELQENASHEDFHGKTFSNQTHRKRQTRIPFYTRKVKGGMHTRVILYTI